ncbi:MAG TPA: hypothetical protein VFS33_03725 [Gemmatimonadales bacterium]|nr:hypothetical protein [Gemmatimonadales bacterium]
MALGFELGEARRNRLLRRVDWRFLLRDPQPAKTLCLADGALHDAVSLISDQVVSGRAMDAADADLAVAVNPDGATLRKAWAGLASDGWCYTEWHGLGSPGPAGIRRRLHAAGFAQVRCYTAWRSPDQCQLWLPLDAPGVRRFFRHRPFPFPSPLRRLRGHGARLVASMAWRVGAGRPICAVAQRLESPAAGAPATAAAPHQREPSGAPGADPEPPFFETIRAEWNRWGLGDGRPQFAWALATGGRRSIAKVVGLVFTERNSRPRLVVKLARVPESIAGLTREATALRALAAVGHAGFPGVPRFLFQSRVADTTAVGQTALSGLPLVGLVGRRTYRALAMAGTEWLAHLANATHAPAPVQRRRIEPVVAEFCECFAPLVGVDQARAMRDVAARLESLPSVSEHRDFAPWNVFLMPDRQLAVLDWESSDLAGLPVLDLEFFLTFLALSLHGFGHAPRSTAEEQRFFRCHRDAMDPSTFAGRVHQECVALYCHRVGLGAELLHPLRLFGWMLHARTEYERLVADAGGPPGPPALGRSVFLQFWREELRRCDRAP